MTGASSRTIALWKQRFARDGLAGLAAMRPDETLDHGFDVAVIGVDGSAANGSAKLQVAGTWSARAGAETNATALAILPVDQAGRHAQRRQTRRPLFAAKNFIGDFNCVFAGDANQRDRRFAGRRCIFCFCSHRQVFQKMLNKKQLLSRTVEHIDITKFDARPIVEAMGKMSFTSRDLSRATGIYNQMLADPDCSVILVIAGSTSAGGCMDLYAELVKSNMVDAIVATGATIVDMDFFEALGHKHYQANEIPDDDTLRSLYIDRIYDTYIDETQLQDCDFTIGKIADSLEPRPYSSRAFIREMGKWLSEGNAKKQGSLVQLAYEQDVPIFCPAFSGWPRTSCTWRPRSCRRPTTWSARSPRPASCRSCCSPPAASPPRPTRR